VCKDPEGYKQS